MKNTELNDMTTANDMTSTVDEVNRERIERARKTLAEILNMLEGTIDEIKCACDLEKWDDSVALQMEDASTKLGFALATLTRWFDD